MRQPREARELELTEPAPADIRGEIVRTKAFDMKPEFVEDAIEQMEALGHDFFFLNAETGQHTVVYRRKAGGYGLIMPSIPLLETSDVIEGLPGAEEGQ